MGKPEGVPADDSDEHLVKSVLLGEVSRFTELIRRHNRSLFRIARSIVRDDREAEDVVQQTHVSAFAHLREFEGRAKFSTWVARIAVNEALARLRQRRRLHALMDDATNVRATVADTPEDAFSRSELARTLELAIDELPQPYRSAFVLRHVEGLDTGEAAAWLGVSEAHLRVLLHRARALLKDRILEQVQVSADEVFTIGGLRCARIAAAVLDALERLSSPARGTGAPA